VSSTESQRATRARAPNARLASILRNYGIHLALVALIIFFSLATDVFWSLDNMFLVLRQVAVIGIIAVGATFVILSGGIDLSVGSMLAVAGLVSGAFAAQDPTPLTVTLALVLPLLTGLALGALNGVLIAYAGVSALIVTLGGLTAYRGLATSMRTNPYFGFEPWYREIGIGRVGDVPIPVLVFIAVVIAAWIVLTRTKFGRYVYAVGGNEEAARASGVPVRQVKLAVYMIAGFLVGLAAIIFNARVGAAQTNAGAGFELQAIAAVVIGGTSILGGRGKLMNTVVGVLIIGVLFNGLVLMQVSTPIQNMVIGAIIVLAVWLDQRLRAREG
jgi:ribose/xylose/arabinose/galactoside ABC-type transport system permease subunit